MASYLRGLDELDRTQIALAGGKGAHLGELSRIAGVRVPPGFVVTTEAFERIATAIEAPLQRLEGADLQAIPALSAEIRGILAGIALPDDLAAQIADAIGTGAHAVRSSATAEDLPTASFAGQHDSWLDVPAEAVLDHVRRCWASLFTERAVTYRLRNGIDARKVRMAVVVQRMVPAEAAGVLFTADPVSGNRNVASVEAVPGLGEALVAGIVSPDIYRVRDGDVIVRPTSAEPPLTDAQALDLVALGRRIEVHFGCPQDVEWCRVGDAFHIVQSRPITTLFPIPASAEPGSRVYVSVGHQQMMTDPLKPLGLSFFQLTAGRPMYEAGGRLFVDVTAALASPAMRAGLVAGFWKHDPLIGDAVQALVDRGFVPSVPAATPPGGPPPAAPIDNDPAIVRELIARSEASLAALERDIRGKSGSELLDFIREDLQELKRLLVDPQSYRAIFAGVDASAWLNDKLQAWLGETNAADKLTQSVPGNVTSEMGLALLDVADAVRPHPDVIAHLRGSGDDVLDGLTEIEGGQEARDALLAWLDRYGMRGVGEIDITRPRWRERPALLVPLILGHVRSFEPGEAARRFARGRQEAEEHAAELLDRLRALPDGEARAEETRRMIDRVRTFAGYREYPKYGMIRRYFVYKQALFAEADRLVEAGALQQRDDIEWLTFPELQEAVRTGRIDPGLLRRRQEAFRVNEALTPPRVLTSEGEVVAGVYRRGGLPEGALVGLAVSAGIVEGRARVVLDIADADLEPGDILVTPFTDPSWTPLFVAIAGLVTEVGGLMTHGAVIAREYGLPAVVGVECATRRIRDGQRIRLHGTEGYVEILAW